MAELTIGLDIENIGPHVKIDFTGKTSSLKTAIYANNGSGKTFISRLFRLIENPINQNSDKLLSFTKNQGKMKFEVKFKESMDIGISRLYEYLEAYSLLNENSFLRDKLLNIILKVQSGLHQLILDIHHHPSYNLCLCCKKLSMADAGRSLHLMNHLK